MIVEVYVKPNSAKNKICGYDEWRKCWIVEIKAPPHKGKANQELENFLSNILGTKVKIVKGSKSQKKFLSVDMDEKEVIRKLEEYSCK